MADRSRLEQVVLNLVVNAEQAMVTTATSGTLSVRTRSGPRSVSLCVEDSGPGIPREHQEQIFDAFWTTKAPGEGTGLGLSLVHGIIQDLGGEIRVDSEPGQGACFTIVLPHAGLSVAGSAPTLAPTPAAPGRALRVLVVDDEASIRSTLSRYLKRRGHHVEEAAEGEAALQQLARASEQGSRFDVIVSDLRMPGLDGGQLLQQLRADASGMEDRLIFLTGDAANPDAERMLRGAGTPVILKPFDFGRMEALIERVAAGKADDDEELRISGDQIHTHADSIRRSFLARLRTDVGMPDTSHLGDADVEDHTCLLISNLAQTLIIPGGSTSEGESMLSHSAELLRVTSDLHGIQRCRLGWTDAHLAREYAILEEEILRTIAPLQTSLNASMNAEAVRTIRALLTRAHNTCLSALRRERLSTASGGE
jgi:CheY-like chemotaxis protein/anti-sigma regulatory factor (Ser/Thr protein kinase)